MEVLLESEEQMGRNKEKGRGKRQRPNGPPAPTPASVADQTGRVLTEREADWLERLVNDPASFAAVEREVHDQARRQADLYVAGLLAKASEHSEMAHHIDKVTAEAEVPLRAVEKKTPLGGPPSGGPDDHGDDALLLASLAYRQGARLGRKRTLPGTGSLPDQRGV